MTRTNSDGNPSWVTRPVVIDADFSKEVPWASVRSIGYSHNLQLYAPIRVSHVSYAERPQYLYVTGDASQSIHAFWFADEQGAGEFDIISGELKHLDCHGCDVSISGTELIFSPHRSGGDRMKIGGRRDVPRNSEELFVSVFDTRTSGGDE